jgi:putative hydrolase of the HAD superfamily
MGIWEVVVDGTLEALDRLRAAGLRLALVSNADPGFRRKLESLGLAERFEQLFISMELGVEKPDPAIFEQALQALNADPACAVHIGDLYEVDVRGARAAGLAAVLVDRADLYTERDVPRIASLADLPALLGV